MLVVLCMNSYDVVNFFVQVVVVLLVLFLVFVMLIIILVLGVVVEFVDIVIINDINVFVFDVLLFFLMVVCGLDQLILVLEDGVKLLLVMLKNVLEVKFEKFDKFVKLVVQYEDKKKKLVKVENCNDSDVDLIKVLVVCFGEVEKKCNVNGSNNGGIVVNVGNGISVDGSLQKFVQVYVNNIKFKEVCNVDVVECKNGESIVLLLQCCYVLGFVEGEFCCWCICLGCWDSDFVCKVLQVDN